MKFRNFGKTTENISEIGHGTWGMGGMWGPRDDRQAIRSLCYSLEKGINFIDTAYDYGNGHSESLIASTFKESKKTAFVATKIQPKNLQWPARAGISMQDVFPSEHIIEQTEMSLKNLRMECVDLQQLHVWQDAWLKDLNWLEAVQQLKEQGKIRYFGISVNDHQPETALEAVKSGYIDSIQVIYNIFEQRPAEELFKLCLKHEVAVIVRVPFDEGALTGTLTPSTQFHKKDWRKHYFTENRLEEVCRRVDKLKIIAERLKLSVSQLALKFCLSHAATTTVIPGMRHESHIDENCEASAKLLSDKVLEELKTLAWPKNFYPSHG
jgi:aryl-alcohol dehydrogenase-like predicted oxidoreductase